MYKQIELEGWLLGGLILCNSALLDCDISESDFSCEAHAGLFNKICELISTNKQCNVADFVTWADENIQIGDMDGYEYVRLLVDGAVGVNLSVVGYAKQLKEVAAKANIKASLINALELVDTRSSGEVLAYLDGVLKQGTQTSIISAKQVKAKIIEEIGKPRNRYLTGIQPLDEAMGGGLYAGYTYGLCGAEKAGKTTLAHTISYNLDCPHLYIAMEMGSLQIEQRNIARDLNINSLQFLKDSTGLKNSVETAKERDNVYYLDCPGADLNEILRNIGTAVLKKDIKGFIVDYWQLVTGQQRGENEEKHLRYVAQSLANFARKQDLWCVLLAQMNKDGGLFGGNGLRKACDQLYMINECEVESGRWLKMDASRYTFRADIGNKESPAILLNTKCGPYFEACW